MRNKFELQLDEKLSLEARLDVLRKYANNIKEEIKKTQDLLNKKACENPNQLDLEQAIADVSVEDLLKPLEVGDLVEIINYGHASFINKKGGAVTTNMKIIQEDENSFMVDISPEMVGRKGFIERVVDFQYSLTYIHGKQSWYNRDQLKLISKNINHASDTRDTP